MGYQVPASPFTVECMLTEVSGYAILNAVRLSSGYAVPQLQKVGVRILPVGAHSVLP